MKLLGIDPSMTGTGLVALNVESDRGLPCVALLNAWTIRPKGQTLLERCHAIGEQFTLDLDELAHEQGPADWTVVIEDPTDFTMIPGIPGALARYKSGAVLGAAVGALLGNVTGVVDSFLTQSRALCVPSRVWLPQVENVRGGSHFQKHADVVRTLRRFYRCLASCNDDETMAAGLALWYFRNQRTADTLARAAYQPKRKRTPR